MNENKKEITGIYNTTFNQKNVTPIKTGFEADLELIENAIIEEVVMYVKGYHSQNRDKGYGAEHIKIHLEQDAQGYINIKELLDLGNSIREYTKIFKEPFIDIEGSKQAKIYEWENENKVRFRVVVDKIRREGLPITPLSPSADVIISFYSDRNLNNKMQFKNPLVNEYYCNSVQKQTSIHKRKPQISSHQETTTRQRKR
ncbi:hypothetical protein BKH42_08170 [Helicobacter sp. 13S00482-2]|uniref:hypothetical protein n=1 Tax=Helicobacter sp. 13S00482-2 TaxID=1476200 RepID=UPI000BD89D80|nr:hypothetical protein [Helicobacter sp. 13S00482-2]PAF53020.1 hypothetical protein BKH42_08170 [Helicobacter sp. 13S00482-2]